MTTHADSPITSTADPGIRRSEPVLMLRSELTDKPRREPNGPTDPTVTGSACAVCGVHVADGTPADFPFLRVMWLSLWRCCLRCSVLRARLTVAKPDAAEQAYLFAEDVTGQKVDRSDPVAREWALSVARLIPLAAQLREIANDSAPGYSRRWQYVDVDDLVADLDRSADYARREAEGVPIPAPYRGCGGCGVNRAAWWSLRRQAGRLHQFCGDCTVVIEEMEVRGIGGFSTRDDRLAADAAGLDRVPVDDDDGYARPSGFRAWCDTPGARPAATRWAYLSPEVRAQLQSRGQR